MVLVLYKNKWSLKNLLAFNIYRILADLPGSAWKIKDRKYKFLSEHNQLPCHTNKYLNIKKYHKFYEFLAMVLYKRPLFSND